MQPESLMTKKKLWGVIKKKLTKGSYELLVDNKYASEGLLFSKGI